LDVGAAVMAYVAGILRTFAFDENTNGLLWQYLPKKTDLSCYSQSDLDEIALRLNQRPPKTLGFQTPADRLQASVASTPIVACIRSPVHGSLP